MLRPYITRLTEKKFERFDMKITPVVSFGTNRADFAKKKPETATQSAASSDYKLSGYNVAFGALIKEYDANPAVLLTPEEKADLDKDIHTLLTYEGSEAMYSESREIMKNMLTKYNSRKAAKYIVSRGINKPAGDKRHEPYVDFMKAYLDTVNLLFQSSPNKARDYLSYALFLRNEDGKTLIHASANKSCMSGNGMIPAIFEATNKFPKLQQRILLDKNSMGQTIGKRMILPRGADGVAVNDALTLLASQTRTLSRTESIELLKANEDVLNEHNKVVLEALLSESCLCSGELSQEELRQSYTSLNNKAFSRLDKLSDEITIHGCKPSDGLVLSNTPSVEMVYMCLRNKETWMETDKVDTRRLCTFFNEYANRDDLVKFYTTPDERGRYVASALVATNNGINDMNMALLPEHKRELYDIYMHKDRDGKTLADYIGKKPKQPSVVKAINDAFVDLCAADSGITHRELYALVKKYDGLFDSRMKRIASELETICGGKTASKTSSEKAS